MINYLLGTLIFGYAAWTIYRLIRKSKKGACGTCAMSKSCPLTCNEKCDDEITP